MSVKTLVRVRHGMASWKARARGRTWCLRFGMTSESWNGWAKMHVHPFTAMGFYFISEAGFAVAKGYLATALPFSASMYCYVVTVPLLLNMACSSAVDCAFWRFGPQVAHHKVYPAIFLVQAACSLPYVYVGYIGPQSTVPWSNRFKFVSVNFLIALFGHLAGAAGFVPGEHPLEPRTSIMKPLYRSLIQAFRLNDSLTDLSLVGELLFERRDGCWWFGQPSRCGVWNSLIAVFCSCAAIDFGLAISLSVVGTENMTKSKRSRRLLLAVHCLLLFCELGVVTCTLLHLFSLQHLGNDAREHVSQSQKRGSIAVTFASLGSTLCTFILTLVGVSNTLAAARKAVHRMSHGAQGFSRNGYQDLCLNAVAPENRGDEEK